MDQEHKEEWLRKRKELKASRSAEYLFEGIQNHDRFALSAGITLIESQLESDKPLANELIRKCLPFAGKSRRIGITGVPGVGKSTFIEAFGKVILEQGYKLAVLTIDPSSATTGGSILGDKTRMHTLVQEPNAYIRPSAAGNTLGGVARATRESIYLCEAAGFDVILIETVGVGQSETMVHSMVDFFLLLMLAGAGDELQGIKRGIMELADALLITKADGENVKMAKLAKSSYANALHLFPPKENEWIPRTEICSSITGDNLDEAWKISDEFFRHNTSNGWIEKNRHVQDIDWMKETLNELILSGFYSQKGFEGSVNTIKEGVLTQQMSAFEAAEKLYQQFSR
ncbi:MAG: methylmalonyl Co-A mutase-associated GTPase MeaB [Crocinitomicaceae bacterium]|nr:methylmalonyl Co-A mutase-associated GTPase MeaB [Crocinitomicaceae bacterium]MCF8410976.1 methylmalonyl Co-A mutase-associated GTPase MeaB [Crocinitomicaceae bacterium]MCF8445085.1 methylmalonyl Co-A mutase-associated GTPase MeaB [Crocinitomicaceae bacterium]